MNLLLDTHTLLWWMGDASFLSEPAKESIASPDNTVFLSPVVIWEIRIKQAIGKLELPDDFSAALREQEFTELPITIDHADAVGELPPVHRDPFDRMLVAQALNEKLTVVTRDSRFAEYGVKLILA